MRASGTLNGLLLSHLFSYFMKFFHLKRESASRKLKFLFTMYLLYRLIVFAPVFSKDRYPNIPSINSLLIKRLFINPQSTHNISMSVIRQTLCNTLHIYFAFKISIKASYNVFFRQSPPECLFWRLQVTFCI